jgi:hypothetical protein
MPLSPIGFILIPVALVLFVQGRRPLLWGTLLSVPFISVAVADIGVTTVKAYQLFGVLLVFRSVLDALWAGSGLFKRSWATILSFAFIFICFASLSMAVVHAGAIEVYTETEGRWLDVVLNAQPLQLSSFNFTQVLYPLFGVLLFNTLVKEIKTKEELRYSVQALVWGGVVTGLMGIIGGVLYTIGQEGIYTGFLGLFSIGPAGAKSPGIGSVGQFFRVYTIAGEPGFTAISLLLSLGLLAGLSLGHTDRNQEIIKYPRALAFVLALALLFNGSTTGYFGAFLLVAWSIIATAYYDRSRFLSFRRAVVSLVLISFVVAGAGTVLQVSGTSFYEWLIEYHFAKLQGEGVGSGQIRSYVTWYTLRDVFPVSPILGVGYGSHLSLSMATFLISNVGLLGFGTFVAFLYLVFRNALIVAQALAGELGTMAFAAVLALPPVFGTLFVAKATSAMNYGVTWTIVALAEASYQVYRRQQSHQVA